ncbi:hypothetical protein BDZ97DRAFT_1017417 [Flammula alnicola]|nr:hypothetical protein BDZ97DRAFT_1017417 [Flammula alnicola]
MQVFQEFSENTNVELAKQETRYSDLTDRTNRLPKVYRAGRTLSPHSHQYHCQVARRLSFKFYAAKGSVFRLPRVAATSSAHKIMTSSLKRTVAEKTRTLQPEGTTFLAYPDLLNPNPNRYHSSSLASSSHSLTRQNMSRSSRTRRCGISWTRRSMRALRMGTSGGLRGRMIGGGLTRF